jgi:hypothetical protein
MEEAGYFEMLITIYQTEQRDLRRQLLHSDCLDILESLNFCVLIVSPLSNVTEIH